jgi:hypothetical protein
MAVIDIAGRKVGEGFPCFVIAEAGVNHNGSVDLALRLSMRWKRRDAEVSNLLGGGRRSTAPRPSRSAGARRYRNEMLKRLELTRDDHFAVAAYARERNPSSRPFR